MKGRTCNPLLRTASRPDSRRTITDPASWPTFNADGCDSEAVHLQCGALILTWLALPPVTRRHFAFNPSDGVFRTSISLFSYNPPPPCFLFNSQSQTHGKDGTDNISLHQKNKIYTTQQ